MRRRWAEGGGGGIGLYWLAVVLGPSLIRAQRLDLQFGDAIPIWLWMDYTHVPGYIQLNIKALEKNAPEPRFKVVKVTTDMIPLLVPDMPEEFGRLPYAAAVSDLIRTALLAHYGGFYLDTDFLVRAPLGPVADLLEQYDLVSYVTGGQNCQRGSFSSNFMAGRKGNPLSVGAWAAIKTKLKQTCDHKDGTPDQGVCCFTPDGQPRKCHIPWGGIGERTSHPVLKDLMAKKEMTAFCFGGNLSFAPETAISSHAAPKEERLDMYKLHWTKIDGSPCSREDDDLLCIYPQHRSSSQNFFGRIAYHMFASIAASKEIKMLSIAEILKGDWAASDLYRSAFGFASSNAVPADLGGLLVPTATAALSSAAGLPGGDGMAQALPRSPSKAGAGAGAVPIPVWLWIDYKTVPGYIELNLRSILRNAPPPMFEIRLVTRDMLLELIPDMPEEFGRINYAAAVSDLIRTALLAHYGGFYMDTDFIVRRPLAPVAEKLDDHDIVSYVVTGQPCQRGIFSSNFMAGRKGNPLSVGAWAAIKTKLKSRCNATSEKQGVCCYSPEGGPRTCNIPWGGIGERTSHPVSRELTAAGKIKMYCYSRLESFVPDVTAIRNCPKGYRLNMYELSWLNLDDPFPKCSRNGNDLLCSYDNYTSNSTEYFNRNAYHMFAAISATREVKALTADAILKGNWAASYLYRDALGVDSREASLLYTLPPLPPISEFSRGQTTLPATGNEGVAAPAQAVLPVSSPGQPRREVAPIQNLFPSKNAHDPVQTAMARFQHDDTQPCIDTYAKWQGKPIDSSDQWQCPSGKMSFVHIPKTAGTAIEGLGKRFGMIWGHDYDSRRWDVVKDLEKNNKSGLATLPPLTTNTDEIRVCSKGCPCGKGCCWWHVPPQFVLDWRPYYRYPIKFCIVRSPFERVLSQYSWNGKGCPQTAEGMKARDDRIMSDLIQFKSKNFAMQDCHYLPQSWYVASHINTTWMEKVWDQKDLSDVLTHQKKTPTTVADAQSCNFVLRYANLVDDLEVLAKFAGSDISLPNRKHKSYSQRCPNTGLSRKTQDLILELYANDFDRFGFERTWPVYDVNV